MRTNQSEILCLHELLNQPDEGWRPHPECAPGNCPDQKWAVEMLKDMPEAS